METEIGTTLREARIRHKVDLTEIEQRTKIRVRYLRALENEEWDLLPGPTYTRSFIRTYASFLGLDGERLADDFRRQQEDLEVEPVGGREPHGLAPRMPGAGGGPRLGAGFLAALAAAALVIVIVVLGLTGGSGDGGGNTSSKASNQGAKKGQQKGGGVAKKPRQVSISLTATAEVWVCALAANGTPVVNGETLTTGTQRGPFRSGKFDLAFGNGAIDLEVDGKPFPVKDTPSPVGLEVTRGRVRVLPEGARPDCT